MAKISKEDYREIVSLTTEELERRLDRWFLFPEEEQDKDLLVAVMEVLAERDQAEMEKNRVNTSTSWEAFLAGHPDLAGQESNASDRSNLAEIPGGKQKPGKISVLHRAAGIAAAFVCILLAGTVTAYAAGVDLFRVFAKWTDDDFWFQPVQTVEPGALPAESLPLSESLESLQALKNAFASCAEKPLLPTWLPERFLLISQDTFSDPTNQHFYFRFSDGENSLTIFYTVYQTTEAVNQFEKDEGNPEIIQAGDTDVYVFSNYDAWTAVWINGNIEGCIVLNEKDGKDDLLKIVASLEK